MVRRQDHDEAGDFGAGKRARGRRPGGDVAGGRNDDGDRRTLGRAGRLTALRELGGGGGVGAGNRPGGGVRGEEVAGGGNDGADRRTRGRSDRSTRVREQGGDD